MVRGTPPLAVVLGAVLALAVCLFMLAPLAIVVLSSFSASEFLVFPPRGLSLRWYDEIIRSSAYLGAAWLSLKLAIVVTVVSVAIGASAAIAITRHQVPGRELLAGLFLSPLVMPTILLGIGLLMVFSQYLNGTSFWALVIGHVVVTVRTT